MLQKSSKYVGVDLIIPTIGVLALTIYYFYCNASRTKGPPGPKGLPFVGCATQLGHHPANTLTGLAKRFGNVFSIRFGRRTFIILNNEEAIRKALLKNEDFSGRPDLLLMQQMSEGMGVIFRDYGPAWKNQKKFAITTLRQFGAGKTRFEKLIRAEVDYLAEEIMTKNGDSFDTQNLLAKASGNIVCELLLGSRMSYNDATYSKLVNCLDTTFFNESTTPVILGLLVAPIMRFLPAFRDTYAKFCGDLKTMLEILAKYLKDHKNNFDVSEAPDFVESFMKIQRSEDNKNPAFQERQILQLLRELFVAGSANISIILRWCLLCFAHYPDHQEKIYQEIVNVIGESGVPKMAHRDQMPYTCAFILEILRHRTLAPLSMPHNTTKETVLNGFVIPRNTPVLTNIWAVHHDPELFDDSEEFMPNRFLNEDGNLKRNPHVIPFSFGSRFCLGEQLAKTQIFLFLVGIIQRFKILSDENKPPPKFSEGVHGILYVPKNFKVTFQPQ